LEEPLPVRHYDWIAHFGRRTPDKTAVVDLGSDRHFSYAHFHPHRRGRLPFHRRPLEGHVHFRRRERVPCRGRERAASDRRDREAAIIGIADPQWSEVGLATVAVKPGHSLSEAEIHAHCAANLARFKCPWLISFVDALPRNASGKDPQAHLAREILDRLGHGSRHLIPCSHHR